MIYGLIVTIVLILTFCFWFMISFRKNSLTLFFMIPIIFGSVALGHLTHQQILGYPTEITPVGEHRLVSFHIVPKTDIYVWILKSGETIPRAYRIDYSVEARKNLFNFGKLLKDNEIVIIDFLEDEEDQQSEFELYKLPRPDWLEK